MITRGRFLESMAALTAVCISPKGVFAGGSGPRRMRLGLISDLHVKTTTSIAPFEKALRYFDRMKADGVVCCGDLATSGILPELQLVGATWDRVFPSDRRSDGRHIEKLFIYGDHDMGGYAWRESRGILPDEELKRQTIPTLGAAECWERCFHEKWSPVMVKEVCGYAFILAHHPRHDKASEWGDFIPGVAETLKARESDLKGRKPFFYLQHRILKDTIAGDLAWGQDHGQVRKALEGFPNCIALVGHGHLNCADERMVWQKEFTALEVPCLRYTVTLPGAVNSCIPVLGDKTAKERSPMPEIAARDGRQGLLMDVYDDRIVIERLEFAYGDPNPVAAVWTVSLPPTAATHAYARRAAEEVAPEFAADARVCVRETVAKTRGKRSVECYDVRFPLARSTSATPRANRYEVAGSVDGVVRAVKEVYSPKCYLHEDLDMGWVKCLISKDEIAAGKGGVRFSVRPLGAFGAKGKAIEWAS